MRVWITRAAIVLGLLGLGSALWFLLAPRGFGWIVWLLGGLLGLAFAIELVVRGKRRIDEARAWDRWRLAIDDASLRRAAIIEMRSRIDRARQFGARLRMEHARLATLLAELLEADGRSREAIEAVLKVPIDVLEPLPAAVIRHARAQAYLHAGELEPAKETLAPLDRTTGDAVLDASISLARGAIALSEDRLDDAAAIARDVAEIAEPGDELHDEALALEAAVLAARDRKGDAQALFAKIDAPGRRRIALLAPARVRELLEFPRPLAGGG